MASAGQHKKERERCSRAGSWSRIIVIHIRLSVGSGLLPLIIFGKCPYFQREALVLPKEFEYFHLEVGLMPGCTISGSLSKSFAFALGLRIPGSRRCIRHYSSRRRSASADADRGPGARGLNDPMGGRRGVRFAGAGRGVPLSPQGCGSRTILVPVRGHWEHPHVVPVFRIGKDQDRVVEETRG
ncbi:hypothetical protein HDK77DRAFT_298395 [Phyllosticta capitalensis]